MAGGLALAVATSAFTGPGVGTPPTPNATGILQVVQGGTGAPTDTYPETVTNARNNLGAAASGSNSDITSLSPTGNLILTPTGNVGIGLATGINSKLTVAGTVETTGFKLTTTPSLGYVLTSDASGVGTWQQAGGGINAARGDQTITASGYLPGPITGSATVNTGKKFTYIWLWCSVYDNMGFFSSSDRAKSIAMGSSATTMSWMIAPRVAAYTTYYPGYGNAGAYIGQWSSNPGSINGYFNLSVGSFTDTSFVITLTASASSGSAAWTANAVVTWMTL